MQPCCQSGLLDHQSADAHARRLVTSGVLDGKLYTVAGHSDNAGFSRVLEVYDPASDTWSTMKPLPAQRMRAGGAVVRGRFYVMGGHPSFSEGPQNTVLVYDPVTDTWATKSPMPVVLGNVKAAVIDSKIYVEGISPGAYEFLVYDPATDTRIHPLSVPFSPPTNYGYESSVAAIDGKFYAAGDQVPGQSFGLTVLRVYDPAGG